MENFLKDVKVSGGRDCEAVVDGLYAVNKLNW